MKVLVIVKNDQYELIKNQIEGLKDQKFEIYKFKPKSQKKESTILELEELCKKEDFSIALVGYYLFWGKLTGENFIETLKKYKIPTILSNI